jgi:uncharacterized protein (TIGR02145 family)
MKIIYLLLATISIVINATAQSNPTKLNIKLANSSEVITYNISDIEEITFTGEGEQGDTPLPVDATTYSISIPAIDNELQPGVWKVMNGDTQVAELCYEYIKYVNDDETVSINERMLVLYPMDSKGKADLTKGYIVSNGGQLVWDKESNTCTYTAGTNTANPSTVYLAEDRFATNSEATDKVATTLVKDVLTDKRGNETETYDVVKIGTQYWMGQNLRATVLTNGQAIAMYQATQGTAWNNTTAPAYHIYGDNEIAEIKGEWGCMYNGYSILNSNLAPKGWDITTLEDWQLLKSYLAKSQSSKVKSKTEWMDTPGNGNNLTGLDIYPGGLFLCTESTNDEYQFARATYWTSDQLEDATFHTPALGAIYIYNSIAIYNTEGKPFATHGYNWGHNVRCLRK